MVGYFKLIWQTISPNMEKFRKVKNIWAAEEIMMGKNKLHQAIPLNGLEQVSPFILLHHFNFNLTLEDAGFQVPPHPHRGFCPITFMFEGSIDHEDSLGNHHLISANEVQWINAGRGIIHSEKSVNESIQKDGRFQGIQLWINLPAVQKMLPASYQPLTNEQIVLLTDKGVEFRLVSGDYKEHKGPAKSNVFTATLRMQAGSVFELDFPESDNVVFYILEGNIEINESSKVDFFHLVVFDKSDGKIKLTAASDSKLLVMSGTPINEPLVTHGPFVMNTDTQILEAMRDYKMGKMGILIQ